MLTATDNNRPDVNRSLQTSKPHEKISIEQSTLYPFGREAQTTARVLLQRRKGKHKPTESFLEYELNGTATIPHLTVLFIAITGLQI